MFNPPAPSLPGWDWKWPISNKCSPGLISSQLVDLGNDCTSHCLSGSRWGRASLFCCLWAIFISWWKLLLPPTMFYLHINVIINWYWLHSEELLLILLIQSKWHIGLCFCNLDLASFYMFSVRYNFLNSKEIFNSFANFWLDSLLSNLFTSYTLLI